ncbi:ABC transporter substrate-binding protein [Natroniella acetigena]|uniref:ABC transporter substrate-binding protein n=1 Tax=Natroniella acetigena TaxID=52004 RepID=UPI00200B3248|nr:ABC transporter substrate-binding protein [Natroniella acetigena]MCK8827163.1 ABC transporter substrate-binding protein [Natroniella acetigena]
MILNKKAGILVVVMAMLFVVVSGCGQDGAQQVEEKQDLAVGMAFEPGNLDPSEGWNGWFSVQSGMGQTLFRLTEEMELEPWLVKSWEQSDQLTWEIELDEGMKFHNGELVDATAVKNSLERTLEINNRAEGLLRIDSIEVKGDKQLLISTTEPNPALVNYLADPMTVIVNAAEAERLGEEFAQQPVLTGPYQLRDYEKDVEIVVERNDDYWGPTAQLEEITFKFIADEMSRVMAFQSGEVDIAQNIPTSSITNLEQQDGLNVLSNSSLRSHMLYLNLERAPFSDLKVRKAINKAVDRDALAESVMEGGAIAGVGPFPLALPFGGEELAGYNYDLEEANRLLEEAGWELDSDGIREKDGQRLELELYTYDARPELPIIAEVVQAQLKEVGIAIAIRSVENITDVLQNGNYDLAMYSMNTAPTADPGYFLEVVFEAEASSNFNNFGIYKVDQLIAQLSSTFDLEERNRLAQQVQEIILEEAAHLFLVYPTVNMGVSDQVTGYQVHPSEFYLVNESLNLE